MSETRRAEAGTEKITPCLWFDGDAAEAVGLYTSLIANSRIDDIHRAAADYPGGQAGGVLMIRFTLAGRGYLALNAGRREAFNDAISLSVDCRDQAEVDHYWDRLTADGGRPIACGWLKDKYGLSWQIVPRRLPELLSDPDRSRARRVMEAMMGMVKLDVAALEAAAGPER